MPVTKLSSKDKVKGWFRRRTRSDDSGLSKLKTDSDTNISLQSTNTKGSNSYADGASSNSVQSSIESSSPSIHDEAPPSYTSSPTNAATNVTAASNEVDTASKPQDPWKQAASLLNDKDRKLFESIDEGGDTETMFADLQKAVSEKQRMSQEKAWKITFGGRRIVLRDVMAKIVTWLNTYKEIGDTIAQADPVHAGLPWAAIKMLLSVFSADQEQMGLILIGLEQLICLITRCSIYQQLYLDDAVPVTKAQGQAMTQLSNAMARLYAKMFSFLAFYLRLLDLNTAVRTLKSFSQPGEVSEMLTEIGTYERRVATEANVCEKVIVRPVLQRIDENAQNTRTQLREMMSRFDGEMIQLWKQLNEDERCKILQWVSDIPYETDHYTARKGRVSGTGEWLLRHPVYTTWRQSDKSTLLWLNGIPGAGKTKLSSMVVDDLLTTLPTKPDENVAFAYFYCDRNRADHNEPVAIIRSIVRQLCAPRDDTSIEACVEDRYLSRKAKGFASDRLVAEECNELLLQLLGGYRNVYIVVDGLDECDRATRHILMDLLDEIIEKFEQSIKIYIASRTDQDLRKRYHEGTHLEVTANDNQADIEKFVLDKMEQSEFCRNKLSPKVRKKILRTFQDKSQGMFQWATLHIGELLQLERNADIVEYLDGLPKGLEAAYDKIYDRIAGQIGSKKDIAFAAFQIVMVSWRPLHPFELAIAVAQHPVHDFILDQDIDISYVLEVCHNLLVVTDGSLEKGVPVEPKEEPQRQEYLLQEVKGNRPFATTTAWGNDFGVTKESICKFAHLSVQEYLETKHWGSVEAHAFMAGICLRTLLCLHLPGDVGAKKRITDESDDDEDDDIVILRVSEFEKKKTMRVIPLAETDNQTAAGASQPTEVIENTGVLSTDRTPNKDTEKVVPRSPLIECYAEPVIPDSAEDRETSTDPNLGPPIGTIGGTSVEHGPEDNSRVELSTFEPPPFECYIELVNTHSHDDNQSCISQEFEPFLESHEGSPLEGWAVYCAQGLSSHLGAQKDTGESKQITRSALRDLLEQFLGTPSESTVHYKAWVRLAQNLWDLDEYREAGGYSRGPAPKDWSFATHANLRVLIRPYSKPALGCAILGHPEVLETWLSKGELDPNECNAQGDSLLHLAARAHNTDTCKILLKHGANPNLPSSSVLTPLGLAVCHRKLDLVRVLAENGADLTATVTPIGERRENGEGSRAPPFDAPIEEAVDGGDADMVKILLDAAKSTSYRGRPLQLRGALTRAAETARADLAALLLSYWKNDQDTARQVIIHQALSKVPQTESGIDVMKVLMKRMKGRTHDSLLHEAVTQENWTFAEALISIGLGVNTPRADYYLETPLHSVFRERQGDASRKCQKLLDWGANVNTRNIHGNTPLALGMMTPLFKSKTSANKKDGDADERDREADEKDKDADRDATNPESTSSRETRLEAIRELLQRGANPNTVNRDGLSPLGLACVYATVTPEVIQLLVDHGAAVNTTQGNGNITMSPLDILHLHDRPESTEERPDDDELENVKGILERKGGKHIRLVDYKNWDVQKRISWIRDNKVGAFDGLNVPSCFSGYSKGIASTT